MRLTITTFLALCAFAPLAHAAPTPQQLCESAMELASAKYAQCRLNAESRDTKKPDPVKLEAALGKCSQKLSDAFTKASDKYDAACAATEPSSAFDAYLKQCSDDATAAAAGAGLPDYAGDLASCEADLSTCEGDLAACEALPPAGLLRTGQTTSYGAGSDGDLQKGIAQGYVDNGDGTITDVKTGLMWEKKSDDGTIHDKDNTYNWCADVDVNLACDNGASPMDGTIKTTLIDTLNDVGGGGANCFAGYCDWRAPNRRELESIVNLQNIVPATWPAFNTGCAPGCTVLTCSCTASVRYWSSTAWRGNPGYAWWVEFFVGDVGGDNKTYNANVRAVRGGS